MRRNIEDGLPEDVEDDAALADVARGDRRGFAAREKHLEAAQYAKIDAMIDRLDLKAGETVLEIGCGWGTCAIRMATKVPGVGPARYCLP